jgi:GNAT superfamily N-acetyltransferase
MTPIAAFWLRLTNRLRFGLFVQEILDRVARIGVVIYPYVLIYEPMLRRPQADVLPEGLSVRQLEPHEAHLIASVPERPCDTTKIRELMKTAGCCAIVDHDELLAYGWFCCDQLRGMSGTNALYRLPPGWAYLFDMYVRPVARGRQLAVHLRHHVQKILADQGIEHCCSRSLFFNRSARRFKHKLGAFDVELRVLLRLKPFPGVDLRLRRKPWDLQIPGLQPVHVPDRSSS